MKKEFNQILKGLTTKEENKALVLEANQGEDLHLFIDFLIEKDLLFVVGWKGEVTRGDVLSFITQRLRKFDKDFNFDDSRLNTIETSQLAVGDFFIKQMKEYQKAVAKHNFAVVDFYTHSDTYFITVVKKTSLTKLKKIIIDDCFFRKFGDTRNKEILYTIECNYDICSFGEFISCETNNFFIKGIKEDKPNEGCCTRCGKDLFYTNGKPMYPMEQIPVP